MVRDWFYFQACWRCKGSCSSQIVREQFFCEWIVKHFVNDCYLLEWVTLFSEANLCVSRPVMYIIHAIMGRMKRPARLQFVNGRVLKLLGKLPRLN